MNDSNERLTAPGELDSDGQAHHTFRPRCLDEFIGQKEICDQMRVFIQASRQRDEPLDHTLLVGPKGLGKTTLAEIAANEMGVGFTRAIGSNIERLELSTILTGLNQGGSRSGSVLFIDEIHRVNQRTQEILYPAMEDYFLDIVIGQGGPGARPVRVPLGGFTLIGATTREGLLTGPLRDRFGIRLRLDLYSEEELVQIVQRDAALFQIRVEEDGAAEIAKRARGTPRIAKRYLRRIRDFADALADGIVTYDLARSALDRLGVDSIGLDETDRRIMHSIIERGGYAALNTIASAVSEDTRTIEDVYEPFLIQIGFLSKTPRGRSLTPQAYEHLGEPVPPTLEPTLLI